MAALLSHRPNDYRLTTSCHANYCPQPVVRAMQSLDSLHLHFPSWHPSLDRLAYFPATESTTKSKTAPRSCCSEQSCARDALFSRLPMQCHHRHRHLHSSRKTPLPGVSAGQPHRKFVPRSVETVQRWPPAPVWGWSPRDVGDCYYRMREMIATTSMMLVAVVLEILWWLHRRRIHIAQIRSHLSRGDRLCRDW